MIHHATVLYITAEELTKLSVEAANRWTGMCYVLCDSRAEF
jgi:hypothetical protein